MLSYQKPENTKEIQIQVELYIACKKAGLNCILEPTIVADSNLKGWEFPDMVVVENYQIFAIVEVKPYAKLGKLTTGSRKQIKRYFQHGTPVFILYSMYDIPYLVKLLLEYKARFLESIDSVKAKCFEADRQNQEKLDAKIAAAFSKFDEVFPGYRFMNGYSLEVLATGVKVLGLPDLLKQMTLYANVGDFFFGLSSLIKYANGGRDRFLNTRKGTVGSISAYYARQERFDEKQS